MSSFNRVIVMGRLGQDPQVKYLASGTAVCELSLACDRQWKDKQTGESKKETDWILVTLWGRTAEIAGEYLQRGSSCLIEGHLQLDVFKDKNTQENRQKLKVVGESLQLLGSKSDRSEQPATRETERQTAAATNFDGPPNDDVPF